MFLDDAVLHGDEEVAGSTMSGLHLLDEMLHANVWKRRERTENSPGIWAACQVLQVPLSSHPNHLFPSKPNPFLPLRPPPSQPQAPPQSSSYRQEQELTLCKILVPVDLLNDRVDVLKRFTALLGFPCFIGNVFLQGIFHLNRCSFTTTFLHLLQQFPPWLLREAAQELYSISRLICGILTSKDQSPKRPKAQTRIQSPPGGNPLFAEATWFQQT